MNTNQRIKKAAFAAFSLVFNALRHRYAKMSVCLLRHHSAFLGSVKKSRLYQIRLVNVLYGNSLLTYLGCYRIYAYRASVKSGDNCFKKLSVKGLKTVFINAKRSKSLLGYLRSNTAVTLYL